MKLPIPYPYIALWPDRKIVDALLALKELPTSQFLYGKSYPVFKSLHNRYYTDCAEVMDFIHDVYLEIIQPREIGNRCKLQTFNFRCSLCNWVGVVAIRYCFAKYKGRMVFEEIPEGGDRIWPSEPSILTDMGRFDRDDVEAILDMMPNERYRKIIRLRYLEGYDNEETAKKMKMNMPNYYNKHREAKLQYVQAFLKEMSK